MAFFIDGQDDGLRARVLVIKLGDCSIFDSAGPAAAHLIVEPFDPMADEPIAPFTSRVRGGCVELTNSGPTVRLKM